MSNRISGILLITLIAICAVIAIEARIGIRSADNLQANLDEDRAATPAGPFRLTLPPLATLGETVGRPLFNQDRRSPEEESNAAPVSPAPIPIGPEANFTVSAIVITEGERAVLVSDPQSGSFARLAEGETIAGWRLDRVEEDRAIFSKGGETREAVLRTFGPPPPRHPRPKNQAASTADSPERARRRTPNGVQKNPRRETFSPDEKRPSER